jgi:hypothetical protein
VAAVIAPGTGKAVINPAALQILAKGLADIGLGGVVVALPVELTGTGQLKPDLEVFGYGLVEQSPLGVARVVELGFGTRWPARVRMRLRWACSGGHGAVPAWGWVPDDTGFISKFSACSASHWVLRILLS